MSYRSSSCWFFPRFTFASLSSTFVYLFEICTAQIRQIRPCCTCVSMFTIAWRVIDLRSFLFFPLLRWFKFKFLVFMIPTSVIFNTHCSCVSLYTGIIISLLSYELLSANLIYILYVFIVALMFLCSQEYGNMIVSPTLNSLPPLLWYTQFTFRIHCFTPCEFTFVLFTC